MSLAHLSRRRFLAGTALLAGAAALPSRLAAASGATQLRIAQPWEIRSTDLANSGYSFTRPGVVETLLAVDGKGRIEAALAESWSVNEEATQWRLGIRENLVFHDGTPCTAREVAASLERLVGESLYLKSAGIGSIDVEGNDLVFSLERPFGPFLSYLVDNSAAIVAPSSFSASGAIERPVGTGPFRIAELELPHAMRLVRHEAWRGGRGTVETVQYDAVPNGETRGNIAIAGDSDLVFNIPAPSIRRVEASGLMTIDRPVVPRVHTLMLNCAKPQFSDRRCRQAINMALDRQAIATGIMRNPALAATQYMPPVLANWHFDDIAPHRKDVAAANALLDEAGWERGADGIRGKDGARFSGTILTFANRPELPVIATAMQAQFREIGYDLAIRIGEWTAIVEAQRDGSLDMGLTSRNLAIVPDPVGTVAVDFASDTIPPGAAGTTGWKNEELRSLVEHYLREGDAERQADLRRGIIGIIHDELPLIPVVWYDQIIAVNRRLSGFRGDPFELRFNLQDVALSG
ncbi:ABC transporter substrate-binding protein [Stappia sp.]|uniref:ABC transporter substrate-binding protein n=1 Tax=Stappia sp. TaxID=1870903 RepID=UPI003A99EAC3